MIINSVILHWYYVATTVPVDKTLVWRIMKDVLLDLLWFPIRRSSVQTTGYRVHVLVINNPFGLYIMFGLGVPIYTQSLYYKLCEVPTN